MGTWGTSIAQDDTVADITAFVVDRLKADSSLAAASAEALVQFRELERDEDEAPLLWLALASVQWKYGAIDEAVLRRVRADIQGVRGLDRWCDDPKLFAKRKAALAKFLAQIEQPNPKPSPVPRLVIRGAPYREGDCLAVLTSDGRYTATLVLGESNTNVEYGKNLIAGLDYLDSQPPALDIFERRPWLFKHHGKWNGEPDLAWYLPVRFRKEKARFSVVGRVELRSTDPKNSLSYAGWSSLGVQILLCKAAGSK